MPLKTLVKVGSLTNLSDARYCAGMGVELLGFSVIPDQPSYISPARFQEIRGWVTGPSIVAELHGLTNRDDLETIIKAYRPEYLELGLKELAIVEEPSLPYILVLQKTETYTAAKKKPAFVLSKEQQVGHTDVPVLREVSSPEEAIKSLHEAGVKGIALYGSNESKPGFTDYEGLAPILEQLEDDLH